MPELPEVETIRRGVEPHVVGHTIREVIVRDSRLRWPLDTPATRALGANGALLMRLKKKTRREAGFRITVWKVQPL